MSYKLNLISAQAAYDLTITSQKPIDTVLLQSNQQIDILQIKDNVCKQNKVTDEANRQNVLLTTLKVDSKTTNKIGIKIRTAEGQQGALNAFIVPQPE